MRTIKFRAWDKHNHEMYKNPDIKRMTYYSNPIVLDDGFIQLESVGQPAIGDHPIGDRHILMQFTGLLDKNGKEIYEDDVLVIDKRRTKCVFKDGSYKFQTEFDEHYYYCADYSSDGVIIGNIWENPEFLKEK